jgi:hypothetical protein
MLRLIKNQNGEGFKNLSIQKRLQIFRVQSRAQNNSANLRFFRRAFGFTLFLTFGAVYLQGLGIFHLSDGILYSLCAATIGQLAGLFVLVLRQKL